MPFRRIPVVSLALIGFHAVTFAAQPLVDRLDVTLRVSTPAVPGIDIMAAAALVSFAAHLDWIQLAGNMAALWFFGSTLEDRMGRVRFLLFYVTAAIATMTAFQIAFPGATAPLGAGPAIASVIATYALRFPTSRILALFFPVFRIDVIEIPAIVCMAVWLLVQLTGAATALAAGFAPLFPWQAYAAGAVWGAAGALTRFRISAETSASSLTRRSNSLS